MTARSALPERSRTLADALRDSFRDALRVPEGVALPVALLWTDLEGQWRGLVPALQALLPELFALGKHEPGRRTGPAIWLRCIVDRTLEAPKLAPDAIPILYLPGVGRQELRAAGECRPAFLPLVELQYRGRAWHQRNGRDWSVEAFLAGEEGLGLVVAQDARTREALIGALSLLIQMPVASLAGRLEADDFFKLTVNDPIRDLLRWMSDPAAFRGRMEAASWKAFCSVIRSDLEFDPEDSHPSEAGEALVSAQGGWSRVWERFCESPRLYPGVPRLLRQLAPPQGRLALGSPDPRRPEANAAVEKQLRADLEACAALPHEQASSRILALEREHGVRRDWVWTLLGESPLAQALRPLSALAERSQTPVVGATAEALVESYVSRGWECDRAALDCLSLELGPVDLSLVGRAVRALYQPWLDSAARRFQEVIGGPRGAWQPLVSGSRPQRGVCFLFVDGLRFDIARMLGDRLDARGLKVTARHRLAPLPTVTATAKPLAMPVDNLVKGPGAAHDFAPVVAATGQPATAQSLRQALLTSGLSVLDPDEEAAPPDEAAIGWTELGHLDELGHKLGSGLAQQLGFEIERITGRVMGLLNAGWGQVSVVTDHGWLVLPGGLPRVELPSHLTSTKWARCAAVRGDSEPGVPTYGWHWEPGSRIAFPPGIGCFKTEIEYAHGGLSLQECVVPEVLVSGVGPSVTASVLSVQWRGMRCRVRLKASDPAVRVDLRLNWKQAGTSITKPKEAGTSGEVSLVVDDIHEAKAAMVVALDAGGNVLDKRPTTVGEAS